MPGWNREERIVRRQRTVYVLSDEAKQSPEVHPRQDSGTEPVAQQKVGNALHANAFFSIVKGKAVPALIVAALMD